MNPSPISQNTYAINGTRSTTAKHQEPHTWKADQVIKVSSIITRRSEPRSPRKSRVRYIASASKKVLAEAPLEKLPKLTQAPPRNPPYARGAPGTRTNSPREGCERVLARSGKDSTVDRVLVANIRFIRYFAVASPGKCKTFLEE